VPRRSTRPPCGRVRHRIPQKVAVVAEALDNDTQKISAYPRDGPRVVRPEMRRELRGPLVEQGDPLHQFGVEVRHGGHPPRGVTRPRPRRPVECARPAYPACAARSVAENSAVRLPARIIARSASLRPGTAATVASGSGSPISNG